MADVAARVVALPAYNADLAEIAAKLPAILSGKEPDIWGIVEQLQMRLGTILLSKIREAFIVKSRGGVGDDGITWEPLDKRTVAYSRRISRAEWKASGHRRGERGILTPEQNKRWRQVFWSVLKGTFAPEPVPEWKPLTKEERARKRKERQDRRRRGEVIPKTFSEEAKGKAAAIAWQVVKAEGAHTILEEFGNRQVDILRDTSDLLASLSPGVTSDGQIFDTSTAGQVTVGTNKHAWHHEGSPGRFPARPFWPTDGTLPDTWWAEIIDSYLRGITEILMGLLER